MTELQKRMLVAVPGIALFIGAIFWDKWSFLFLLLLLFLFCLFELSGLFSKAFGVLLPQYSLLFFGGLFFLGLAYSLHGGGIAPAFWVFFALWLYSAICFCNKMQNRWGLY